MKFIGVFLFPEQVEEIIGIDSLFTAYKNSINILLDSPEIADEDMIKLKLWEMIILISKSQILSVVDFLVAMFSLTHIEFKASIKNNIYSNLNIENFAKLCNMSLSSFKRKFTKVYAESPKNILIE